MARISAITNDGKEQSKAEGNLKSVLKMASLIAGNNHQIIINKNELDGFVTESKLEICTLLPQEIIVNMSFHGTINCACGTYGNIHMQLYYTDFPEKDYYVIFRVVMDGKDVYNNPKSVRSFTGMIELTL